MPAVSGVDVSELSADLKKHVQEDRVQILERLMIKDTSFLDYMQLFDDVTDEIQITEMFINSVLQPGNKDDFNAKGTAKFKVRTGKVRACKVDITIKPTQITAMHKSWLGKIKKSSRTNVYDLLLEQEIMNMIVARAKQDLRMKALFLGKYNPDGTNPEDTMEGILRILAKDFINAQVFAGAPVTVANAIDQVEGVLDLVPGQLDGHDMVAVMDPVIKKYYKRDYRQTHGGLNYNNGFEKDTVDGAENVEMIAEIGLAGTGAIIVTPRNNMTWLTDSTGKQDSVTIEKSKRNIDIMMDFDAAPNISVMELVWCNEQALTFIESKYAGSKRAEALATDYWTV